MTVVNAVRRTVRGQSAGCREKATQIHMIRGRRGVFPCGLFLYGMLIRHQAVDIDLPIGNGSAKIKEPDAHCRQHSILKICQADIPVGDTAFRCSPTK